MSFGENLRMIRKEKNITQEQLAQLLDVSRQAVSKWESDGGYPETEKLILISKKLNISQDYLLLDQLELKEEEQQEARNCIIVPTGKIAVQTWDGKNIVVCHKVTVSRVALAGKTEPKYLLLGVDKVTLWGEHTTNLGWYANEEDVQKEMNEIVQAIREGVQVYELKYYAKVKFGFLGGVLLAE